MFNEKEQEIIQYGVENGKTQAEVQKAIVNFRLGITAQQATTIEQEPSFLEETSADIRQVGTEAGQAIETGISRTQESLKALRAGEQGFLRTGFQLVGQGAGTVASIIGSAFKGLVKVALPQKAETAIKRGIEKVATPIVESETIKNILERYNSLDPRTKRNIDSALGFVSLGAELTGISAGARVAKTGLKTGVRVGKQAVVKAVDVTADIVRTGRTATKKIALKLGTPKPTPIKAVGEVLQGKVRDIKAGVKGLSALDTTGVKTFKDLGTRINNKIADLAQQVDADLALDITKRKLDDLIISGKTAGGKTVSINPVERGLNQLDELYTKIGDNLRATDIRETLAIAKKTGLTNLEINDLARLYGQEFGRKAFGKLGDPLTSVNAQLYENTRKALKDLARIGVKGAEAKVADATMSSLFNVSTLVKRNIEAVNRIQQKIKGRGLFEKIGHGITKYADVLTGGTLRGLAGGLLPRGVGNKVMNALDIEKALARNLKIIQEAIASGSDAEIIKILGKLN